MRALPLLFVAALTAAAPCQEAPQGTVLVQGATGDVVLNKPLLDAIVQEPSCLDAVRAALPSVRDATPYTDLPAPHLAGTFQVFVNVDYALDSAGSAALSPEQRRKLLDIVVAHLKKRLDSVIVLEPRELLESRRAELQRRHRELQSRQAESQARLDTSTAHLQSARRRGDELQTQLAAARLDVAVEQRAQAQVEQLHRKHVAQRDELLAEREKRVAQRGELMLGTAKLNEQLNALVVSDNAKSRQAEIDKIQADLRTANAAAEEIGRTIDAANERLAEQQRMLTAVLDQLPTTAIALHRALARVDALTGQAKQAEEALTAAESARRDCADLGAEADQAGIDLTVTKSLLVEVEGKLARLQPLRYQVLYGR